MSMPHQKPLRIVSGCCPACGPSRISVFLEGASHFIGLSTPNWSCSDWKGRCCNCHSYLEACFEDEKEAEKLHWTLIDEEAIDFLLRHEGKRLANPEHHPTGSSEF
jgi:hypothetical protein